MERLRGEESTKRLGGGLKDKPLCEHCGRPVRITSQDYARDEVLCLSCASENRTLEMEGYEFSRY